MRHLGFVLLNAVGRPADIEFDPGIRQNCDIHLGLRAVDPIMTFAIKLSGESEFTTITAPSATPARHFNFEFHWKSKAPMAGQKIVVRSLGKPLYLEYVRFVPYETVKSVCRVPCEHLTILQESGRHFAFPGWPSCPMGICWSFVARATTTFARGKIVMVRSRDGGKTWSAHQTIYDFPSDDRDPAILCLNNGTLIVSFDTWDSWRSNASVCKKYPTETARMEKEGWGKYSGSFLDRLGRRRRELVHPAHGPGVQSARTCDCPGRFAQLDRFRKLIEGVSVLQNSPFGRSGINVVQAGRHGLQPAISGSGAVLYHNRTIDVPPTWEFLDEANLAFLPGQKAVATIRVDLDGYVRQAYSRDGGRNWSWPRKLPVWGYPQQLCPLADGRLLLSYGYRKEPFGIRACTSCDGGRTYDLQHEIVLRHDGADHDLGYPYSIQLRNGNVFTVYYHNRKGTGCYVEGVEYRP